MVNLGNDWDELLKDEFKKEYYINLREFLKEEYSTRVIYPNMYNIFDALKHTSYKDTKVLILRTRSISWRKSGPWVGFFCTTRSKNSSIFIKYV